MARQTRIQFENAVYHVMARGDRRERIVESESDCMMFIETFAEACAKTGWLVHAWVLMSNHYHLVLRTPQANLVAGMRWMQNTYTRRFNLRHQLWGHLFGGRYKAVLVESGEFGCGDYLSNLIDYVHLNPVRGGIVDGKPTASLIDYPWSSLSRGYALAPRKRPPWLKTDEGFGIVGLQDSAGGRRRYVRRLEEQARQSPNAPEAPEHQSLQSTLRRGWYWGSEQFRAFLLEKADPTAIRRNRNYQSTQMGRDHARSEAEALMRQGLKRFKLSQGDLESLPGSDPRKVAIADSIHKRTTTPLGWTAERLQMKSAANVSQQLSRLRRRQTERPGSAGKTQTKVTKVTTTAGKTHTKVAKALRAL
jgi:putative transposase